jgi:hypothetical protein
MVILDSTDRVIVWSLVVPLLILGLYFIVSVF